MTADESAAFYVPSEWVMVPKEVAVRLAGGAKGPRGGRVVLEADLLALDDALASEAKHPAIISHANASNLFDAALQVLNYVGLSELMADGNGKAAFGIRIEDLKALRDACIKVHKG